MSLEELLRCASLILFGNAPWRNSVAAASVLLHHMFPHLLPRFDGGLSAMIVGRGEGHYDAYRLYVYGLREFLQRNAKIINVAERNEINPLRLVDMVLTKCGQRKERA